MVLRVISHERGYTRLMANDGTKALYPHSYVGHELKIKLVLTSMR